MSGVDNETREQSYVESEKQDSSDVMPIEGEAGKMGLEGVRQTVGLEWAPRSATRTSRVAPYPIPYGETD